MAGTFTAGDALATGAAETLAVGGDEGAMQPPRQFGLGTTLAEFEAELELLLLPAGASEEKSVVQ